MPKLLVLFLIGCGAGAVDVLPMLVRGASATYVARAFAHWVVVGILIGYADLPLAPWLKGVVVSTLIAVPVLIGVLGERPTSALPIAAMAVVLGAGIGWLSAEVT